jgi:hypothetical protein
VWTILLDKAMVLLHKMRMSSPRASLQPADATNHRFVVDDAPCARCGARTDAVTATVRAQRSIP